MPVKEWVQKFQPMQLYVVLTLTILFFITELIVSHLTHALTLLMDSYHMLCNILALSGCIITIKHGNQIDTPKDENKTEEPKTNLKKMTVATKQDKKTSQLRNKQESKLRNTFGWTRIDVITMLICCVFLASFSFSIYVEALQTLAHIDHQDEMHHPWSVLCIGATGLLLNGVCFLLIGGYTFHQGSFLYVTESGDVVLNKIVVNDSVRKGGRRLSRTRNIFSSPPKKRQGLWETTRDIIGCVLVMICSLIVMFTDPQTAKYVDPIISLISATCIMTLSYPYIKESCLILLQTMPDTIDIDTMGKQLVNHFPDIINIHDFHIWQLTASKVISTVHIIFENPKVYRNILEEIKEFFIENGVTQLTIQPEFYRPSDSMENLSSKLPPVCLVACQGEDCKLNHCCPIYQEINKFKQSGEKIIYKENSTATLKSVKIIDEELHSLHSSTSTPSLNTTGTVNKQIAIDTIRKDINKEKPEEGSKTSTTISTEVIQDSECTETKEDIADSTKKDSEDTSDVQLEKQ
ncbi:zinc transporter 77C [Rhynchophorus ferrugineus]|uniref:zinc transporter 77C n=1 Tax=Rhynchophorus ferrugineus TaxID=354439 RepID=UPI003FCEA3E8